MQPDMEFIGVSDVVSDYRVKTAMTLDIPVYVSVEEKADDLSAASIPVAGGLPSLLDAVDVVVDCTLAGVGAANLDRYREHGVNAIFQCGEKHSLTDHSFVAHANYETALGRDATRVVSCNPTATVRTLSALRDAELLKKARGVLIRRATDPWESDHSGIMNTVVPEGSIPSHQGPDAQTVVPELDVVTIASKGARTQNHIHYGVVELSRKSDREEVLDALRAMPRIAMIRLSDGIVAQNSTIELMEDLGRPRGDMYEVALWEDILKVDGNELYYTYTVDNQAVVIPENIDAIRALVGTVNHGNESVLLTDATLGIRNDFLTQSRGLLTGFSSQHRAVLRCAPQPVSADEHEGSENGSRTR